MIFAFLCLQAALKVWGLPVHRFIFLEHSKVGQKLQLYDTRFQEFRPQSHLLHTKRWVIICIFATAIYILGQTDIPEVQAYFPQYSELFSRDPQTQLTKEFFAVQGWVLAREFGIFSLIMWFGMVIEGRTRFIARFIGLFDSIREKNEFKIPLPEIPFDAHSDKLNMCIFTGFLKDERELGKDKQSINESEFSLSQTKHEKWFPLPQDGMRGNMIVIGPTGSGKTSAFVKPLIEQVLVWQAKNPEKKASVVVYDPKAELTGLVKDLAIEAGREEDLIIFSLNGEHAVNVIWVDNPWDGEVAFKVSGWILSAWQNFQGKSSSEPYWENQNYILCQSILTILYFEQDTDVTLADVATVYNLSAGGCFKDENGKITELGKRGLRIIAGISGYFTSENIDYEKFIDLKFENPNVEISKEIKDKTRLNMLRRQSKYTQERIKFYRAYDSRIQELWSNVLEGTMDAEIKYKAAITEKIKEDLKTKFQPEPSPSDYTHTALQEEGKKLFQKIIDKYGENDGHINASLLLGQSMDYLFNNWSKIPSDNRGSVASNIMPFLRHMQTPGIDEVFSPREEKSTLSMDRCVLDGRILVPDFPGIKIGARLSNALITLIKNRWQASVLANGQNEKHPRIKVQLADEAQKIMIVGDGGTNIGDFDYCELSRSFGGVSVFLSQSMSSLEAKAARKVEWDKVHGVVRSIVCLSTNDSATIKAMQESTGKEYKENISRTVNENHTDPTYEAISEKHSGNTDSMGISYTVSQNLEDRLQVSDIQGADAFAGVAVIYDGKRNHVLQIGLRPAHWPNRRDKYELMQKADFNPKERNQFRKAFDRDSVKEAFKANKAKSSNESL